MVGDVIDAVAGIELFIIDKAEYFISYPLFFVIPIEVVFHTLSQILDAVTTELKKIVFDNSLNYTEKR